MTAKKKPAAKPKAVKKIKARAQHTNAVTGAKISNAELAASYGFMLSTLNSNPELRKLTARAVKAQYTPERFQAELRGTKWFQSRSKQVRETEILRTSDPAQYAAQVEQTRAAFADQWAAQFGGTPPDLNSMAELALRMGWNEAQIKDSMAGAVNWRDRVRQHSLSGSSKAQLGQYQQAAAAYGVKPTEDWFADRLQAVNSGDDTDEGVLESIKGLAKQRYAAFADQIDAGLTLNDLTENYRQSIGNILEQPPAQVDVFNKHIQNAITRTNADGMPEAMSITDFEKSLRNDTSWQFTKNANDTLMGLGHSLVKSFGLAAL